MFRSTKHRTSRRSSRQTNGSARFSRRRLLVESLEHRRLLTVGVKDPGHSYVDVNDDGVFYAPHNDVALVSGELDDGFFDTDVAEGGYSPATDGAGLFISGAAISNTNLNFSADGNLTVNTDLTATTGNLLLTSREGDVRLDDPTLQARNLLQINADVDIVSSDDVLRATGPSSVIRLDAGRDVLLTGTSVDAKKLVDIDAVDGVWINPSGSNAATVTATPSGIGKIDIDADYIDVEEAILVARKDIVMQADVIFAPRSQMTANGHGLAKIDLHGYSTVNIRGAEILARKTVDIEVYGGGGGLLAGNATIETGAAGSTSVILTSHTSIAIVGATVRATSNVIVDAHGDVFAFRSTLDANTSSAGTVSVRGYYVDVGQSIIEAKRDVFIESGTDLFARFAFISATGPQIGRVNMSAGTAVDDYVPEWCIDECIEIGGDVLMRGAVVKAGISIDIAAEHGSIFARETNLLACGKPLSTVRLLAEYDIILDDAVVRAGKLIDLLAGDLIRVNGANLGIWYNGVGDISVSADTVRQIDAVFTAPDTIDILGSTIIGTATEVDGTVGCPDVGPPDLEPEI